MSRKRGAKLLHTDLSAHRRSRLISAEDISKGFISGYKSMSPSISYVERFVRLSGFEGVEIWWKKVCEFCGGKSKWFYLVKKS
jgi:hypothetical protein